MLSFRRVHSVSWQEAKLFAIDGIFGARRYPHPTIFELSGTNDIVRWTWMRHSNLRVLFYAQPVLSEEDYNLASQLNHTRCPGAKASVFMTMPMPLRTRNIEELWHPKVRYYPCGDVRQASALFC